MNTCETLRTDDYEKQANVSKDTDERIMKEVRKQMRWLSFRTKVAVVVAALIGAFGSQLVITYISRMP